MKMIWTRVSNFFRIVRNCMDKAARDTDTHYYIPKSRFRDRDLSGSEPGLPQGSGSVGSLRGFFQNLGDCLATAWKESDSYYHIPKTRFRDAAENGQGCRPTAVPGISAPMTSDFIGSGIWSVRPEDQSASSVSGKTAETDGAVYEESGGEAFNPPRLSKE